MVIVIPDRRRIHTKSSKNWKSSPGNLDRTNLFKIFPSNNYLGIPSIPATDYVPEYLIQYGDKTQIQNAREGGALHEFLDDYRFESSWQNPSRAYEKIKHIKAALSPDFSLYRGMPITLLQYNLYRNHWVACYWLSQGMEHVVPTVGWAGRESFSWCFSGCPTQSVVAVSPLGNYETEDKELFVQGYVEMCNRLEPTLILSYGKINRVSLPTGLPPVKEYPDFWELRKADMEAKRLAKFVKTEEDSVLV